MWIAADITLTDDCFSDDGGNVETLQKRFLPERFTPDCRAIDEKERKCERNFACRECFMEIPQTYFDSEPMCVPMVGTSGAGKTFFLTALHKMLKENRFEKDYGMSELSYVTGLHASKNTQLEEQVQKLFSQTVLFEDFVALRGTEVGDHEKTLHRGKINEKTVAHPFTYVLGVAEKKYALGLYDCKGSVFTQGGEDSIGRAENVFTESVRESDFLFFLYDPTQTESCVLDYTKQSGREIRDADGNIDTTKLRGLEGKITEPTTKLLSSNVFGTVAGYIRGYSELTEGGKYTKHICIIVTKSDEWKQCLPPTTQEILDRIPEIAKIPDVSEEVENWIGKCDPAFVTAVKEFAIRYTYIPVSAAGRPVTQHDGVEGYYVRGSRGEPLKPSWVDVPFLVALQSKGLINV